MKELSSVDPEVAKAIADELERSQYTLELIASENIVSEAVLEAQGSIFTNKYAEGYPGKRYYGGCEHSDTVETLAIERAKKLFGAEHANVQPHSGSQANMAVYQAVLEPGDTVMGMDLSHGGHLTHGSPVNFSGYTYNVVSYGVSEETERIDYEKARAIAQQHRPKLIVVGASAYPRFIDYQKFREIADEIEAKVLVDMAHWAGLVAAKVHPDPVPHADFVTTTTHKTLRGPRGGMILCREEYAPLINRKVFPGIQGGPLVHVIAAKAVALHEASQESFVVYQKQVLRNAQALAEHLQKRGLRLISGGTDTHLLLVDLRNTDTTGKAAEKALEKANIATNKNMIPFDPRSPFITSGIRLGTPALTTRGMGEAEMREVADMISDILEDVKDKERRAEIRNRVRQLCERFPIYRESKR